MAGCKNDATVTRTQLKFASASAAFLNHGGLAITALGRMLFLLFPAVLSDCIHRIFVAVDRWFIQQDDHKLHVSNSAKDLKSGPYPATNEGMRRA